jgi:penicillin-binding protein 1C
MKRWVLALVLLAAVGLGLRLNVEGTLLQKKASQLFVDRQGLPIGEVSGEAGATGYWPLPTTLPEKLVLATLETEDRTYFDHPGVRLGSIVRATWQNIRHRKIVSGASTIAMQVARLQRPQARTPLSKLREALDALTLIRTHGHDLVLRQYLTLAPYGNNAHGAARAARLYFDKPLEDLSWLQAAYLAALPQQPGRMSPFSTEGRRRGLRRAHRILRQLHDRGLLDAESLAQALASDVALAPKPCRDPSVLHLLAEWKRSTQSAGPIITTTLDLRIQREAFRTVRENVRALANRGVGTGAALVIDPSTGDVLARVGSHDYFDSEAHGAIDFTSVRRSPGSALKPFIYAAAIDTGAVTTATMLADTPVEFGVPGGGVYVPENVSHTFLGPMSMRQALANSRNIPALRVLTMVGVDRMVELFDRGGVKGLDYSPQAYGLPMALGSLHVTPQELAQLYTTFANQGVTKPLRHFVDVESAAGQRLFGSEAAALVRHVLADPEARQPSFPAGSALDYDFAVAIKTGTSQGYRDAWAAALSDRLLVVTWFGNHDLRRMHLASGVGVAAPAAKALLTAVMPLRAPSRPVASHFPLPATAVHVDVCALSGQLLGPGCTHTRTEAFIAGTEPVDTCDVHVEVDIDRRTGLLATPTCPKAVVSRRRVTRLADTYAAWARKQRLQVAPHHESPLCPSGPPAEPSVAVTEPRVAARYLFDPDTPREFSTIRFAANVSPPTAQIIWVVDGQPVAQVGYPHHLRWSMQRGPHSVRAELAGHPTRSQAITFFVAD